MQLIRRILFEIEKAPNVDVYQDIEFSDVSADDVYYHLLLLKEAGLIEAISAGQAIHPRRLTWDGHEFLDAARDDTRWHKTVSLVQNKAGALIFEVLKQALIKGATSDVLGQIGGVLRP
jgi:DNA-binding transcriptional ArsR family regulator